jgi:hypothetical protein
VLDELDPEPGSDEDDELEPESDEDPESDEEASPPDSFVPLREPRP